MKWNNFIAEVIQTLFFDRKTKIKRPITERIKTFEDACKELGEQHPLVRQCQRLVAIGNNTITKDVLAYSKLRVIVTALNEGWCPGESSEGKFRYYPVISTALGPDEHEVTYTAERDILSINACRSNIKLTLKSKSLAEYVGSQFKGLLRDYLLL